MGYKYLQKPSPENADRHWLTCTCNTQSEKAACSAEAEMSEGSFNLVQPYHCSTWRISSKGADEPQSVKGSA